MEATPAQTSTHKHREREADRELTRNTRERNRETYGEKEEMVNDG